MKIVITPEAHNDIAAIREFISQDNARMGDKVAIEIYDNMERLEQFPKSGKELSVITSRKTDLRYITTYDYATIYRMDKNIVYIIAVIHTSRSFNKLEFDSKN